MSAAAIPFVGLPFFQVRPRQFRVLRWRPMTERAHQTALIQRVAEHGDRAAFAELFAHYAPRIKGFLMRGGASPSLAEELVQEVMLTIWSRAKTFDAKRAAVSTWVYTIARNKRIDRLRKQKYAQVDLDDPALIVSKDPSPETSVAQHQRRQAVHEAMAQLPDTQRTVMHAAYFEGLSQSEIASRLDLPIGTVKSRTRLATHRLQDTLAILRDPEDAAGDSS